MTLTEKEALVSFKNVITKFLGNTKDSDYINIVGNMIEKFNKLDCFMNPKIHFLNSHLDFFLDNLGNVREEHRERIRKDIRIMERRYQGRWNTNMIRN